ncbi:hypothetical protein Agub_g9117 [Astrephomene gubernaculifera]|uniref:Serine/threonine-protein phosphatase 2A activator n=1 Tax=Astrephomene gubernaculifera TaxID=47775 RepID=A0AAD3DSS4_9CHLO|nr:hypothetical protein Agub_g9117 [Astrephomene gubernaculifera]
MQRPSRSHSPGPEGDGSPGFPTSAPYHTKDTLSPTAAPWASTSPSHAPPPPTSTSTSTSASSAAPGPLTTGLALPRPGSTPAGGSGDGSSFNGGLRFPTAAAAGTIGLGSGSGNGGGFFAVPPARGPPMPVIGGAGGGFPAPGAAAAAVAASHAAAAPRKAPEAVITVVPAMPSVVQPVPQYHPARKRIGSAEDLKRFLEGESARHFMAFILSINEAVTGKKTNDPSYIPSPAVQRMVAVLTELATLVDQVPPEEQSLRYGNPAFRTWIARLTERAPALLESVLGEELRTAAVELVSYFLDSFGNATRIDYGTGHETQFCALLYCLSKLGVFGEADRQGLGLVVFKQYLELMRKIQTTYWLEPAGSHGVWGLDDYQFLAFIWGSAQLVAHPLIKPKSIHNADVLEAYADTYLYLGCVAFVKQVKKGPLWETSPMLNDISTVPNWGKVNSGLVKMYQVEVLSKLPIMQHFMFGSLLPFE